MNLSQENKAIRETSKNEFIKTFSSQLYSATVMSGKTSKEIAKACHITPVMLSSYMTGKALPTMATSIIIANELNVSLDDLFDRKKETYKPIIRGCNKKIDRIKKMQAKVNKLIAELDIDFINDFV